MISGVRRYDRRVWYQGSESRALAKRFFFSSLHCVCCCCCLQSWSLQKLLVPILFSYFPMAIQGAITWFNSGLQTLLLLLLRSCFFCFYVHCQHPLCTLWGPVRGRRQPGQTDDVGPRTIYHILTHKLELRRNSAYLSENERQLGQLNLIASH